MNILPGKKFWKTAAALLAAAVIPAVSAVETELPGDIQEIHRYSGEALRETWEYLQKVAEKSIWDNRLTEPQIRFALTWYTTLRLAVDVSGLEDIKRLDRISRKLPDGTLLHEEFVEIAPDSPGLINTLPAAENRLDTAEFLASLPPGTALAAAADIRPAALLEALDKCGAYREKLLSFFPVQFPLREILRQCDGVWICIMVDDKNFYTSIPDKDGMVFRFAALLNGKKNLPAKTRRLEFNNGIIVRDGQRMNMYSSRAMEARMAAPSGTPCVNISGLPQRSCGIFFASSSASNRLAGESKLNNITLKFPDYKIPDLMLLSREKNGLQLVSKGKTTLLADDINVLIEVLPFLKKIKLPEEKQTPEEKPPQENNKSEEPPQPPPAVSAVQPEKACRCAEIFADPAIKKALDGNIPAGFYLFTPQGLVSGTPEKYDLVFFGKIATEQNYPQFITFPHRDSFCVRFSDGTAEKFHLTAPRSFRRMTGCLMTVKRFDEPLFVKLIKIAEKFDMQLPAAK